MTLKRPKRGNLNRLIPCKKPIKQEYGIPDVYREKLGASKKEQSELKR